MTPFSSIYDRFLMKITDYSFVNMQQEDLQKLLKKWLLAAVAKVKKHFKVDLEDRDDVNEVFNVEIDDLGQEILAAQMVVEWLEPIVKTTEHLKMVLTDRDFRTYSQANHIDELLKLRKEQQEEVDRLIIDYTYNKEDLKSLNLEE